MHTIPHGSFRNNIMDLTNVKKSDLKEMRVEYNNSRRNKCEENKQFISIGRNLFANHIFVY